MAYKYKNVLNLQASEEILKDVIDTVLDCIRHPEHGLGSIDFNAITPMPPWVKVNGDIERKVWCKEHWGVYENAMGLDESVATYDGGETIEFDTLGGDIRELMRKLSMMFPQLDFTVDYLWACEDVGKDTGAVQFIKGEQVYEYIPESGSSTAYEMAFDVFSTSAEVHGLVFDDALGTYRYDGNLLTCGEVGYAQKE